MKIFSSEAVMQEWLSKALRNSDGLSELIIDAEKLDNFSPSSLAERKIADSYRTCLQSLSLTQTITENENISSQAGDILKPDFILYALETQSIVIVELKNLSGTTRQAGTELGAYSCEIKSAIPFISDGDIVHVIISQEWPTLLKHFCFHQMFWQKKNLICLEPSSEKNDIRLKLLDIPSLAQGNSAFMISDQHLGGYQICLYDDLLYQKNADRSRLDQHVEQMKTALHAMAVCGNSHNNHGFAFLWKDYWRDSLAPYSITVVNFAPFRSIERFLHIEHQDGLPMIIERLMKVSQEHEPDGHGQSLSEIYETGKRFLNIFCSPHPEAFCYWDSLKKIMRPRARLIAFEAWGMFGEIFEDKLAIAYEQGHLSYSSTSPHLGLLTIEELVDPHYNFIDLSHCCDDSEDDEEVSPSIQ